MTSHIPLGSRTDQLMQLFSNCSVIGQFGDEILTESRNSKLVRALGGCGGRNVVQLLEARGSDSPVARRRCCVRREILKRNRGDRERVARTGEPANLSERSEILRERETLRDSRVDKLNMVLQRRRNRVRKCANDGVSCLAIGERRKVGIKKGVRLLDSCRNGNPVSSWGSLGRLEPVLRQPLLYSINSGGFRGCVGKELDNGQTEVLPSKSDEAPTSSLERCWPYAAFPGVLTSMSLSFRPAISDCTSAMRRRRGASEAAGPWLTNEAGCVSLFS